MLQRKSPTLSLSKLDQMQEVVARSVADADDMGKRFFGRKVIG